MFKDISATVITHLSLLLALCDPSTPRRLVQQLLKSADNKLLHAIGELVLNSKNDNIPVAVKSIITNKSSKQKKRLTLIKQWHKIGLSNTFSLHILIYYLFSFSIVAAGALPL